MRNRIRRLQRAIGIISLGVLVACSLAFPAVAGLIDAQRRDAILSIAYYARAAANHLPEPGARLTLEQAVAILRADWGPRGEWRRQYSIAELAASGLDRRPFRRAIAQLGGTEVLRTLDFRLHALVHAELAARDDTALQVVEEVRGRAFEACSAGNMQVEVDPPCSSLTAPGVSKCPSIDERCTARLSCRRDTYRPYKVTITLSQVSRPLDKLAQIIDAQNWKRCVPVFFAQSYKATPGSYSTMPKPLPDYEPARDTSPPTPGETWEGSLFEDFGAVVPNSPGGSGPSQIELGRFRNILWIESERSQDRYRLDYCLERSIGSKVPMWNEPPKGRSGGIDMDCGHASATTLAASGLATIEAVKTIAFSRRGDYECNFNGLSCPWGHVMGREMQAALCGCSIN